MVVWLHVMKADELAQSMDTTWIGHLEPIWSEPTLRNEVTSWLEAIMTGEVMDDLREDCLAVQWVDSLAVQWVACLVLQLVACSVVQ